MLEMIHKATSIDEFYNLTLLALVCNLKLLDGNTIQFVNVKGSIKKMKIFIKAKKITATCTYLFLKNTK